MTVRFVTPTFLRADGEVVRRPEFHHVFKRLRDRINALSTFFGNGPLDVDFRGLGERAEKVRTVSAQIDWVERFRTSSKTRQRHELSGFVGEATYEADLTEFLPWLLWANSSTLASTLPGEMVGIRLSRLDTQSYRQFFNRLTGNAPYGYQEELAAIILRGESVVLRAPTGSGKTWATLAPFLYTRIPRQDGAFVDRVIYVLPLRSLASDLQKTTIIAVEKCLARSLPRIVTCARERRYGSTDVFYVTLQMGGQQDDPFFEGRHYLYYH